MGDHFEERADYALPLLKTLAEIGSGRRADVVERFEYRWGAHVPAEHRKLIPSGTATKLDKHIGWISQDLRDLGFLVQQSHGIWAIAEKARHFLQDHASDADSGKRALFRLIAEKRARRQERNKPPTPGISATPKRSNSPTNLPAVLSDTSLRSIITSQRSPAEHAAVHARVDRILVDIQHFLSGRVSRPSDEQICEWIQFCYSVELYAEVTELFNTITQDAIESDIYRRVQRLARAARLRVMAN